MSARAADFADALTARGYDLRGFSCPVTPDIKGKRVQVATSRLQNLCVFLGYRSFHAMPLDAARAQYPWMFA